MPPPSQAAASTASTAAPRLALTVRRVNYRNPRDRAALLSLLDSYARDPMGGGQPLPEATHQTLCDRLAAFPGAASFIAWQAGEPPPNPAAPTAALPADFRPAPQPAASQPAAPQPPHPLPPETPIGLLNSFMGFSTFKAQPLLNVHDIAVLPAWRGQGIAQQLLAAAEAHARQQGCCKLTLEVLGGNAHARASYQKFGFEDYTLDPAAGQAMFMHKWLAPALR